MLRQYIKVSRNAANIYRVETIKITKEDNPQFVLADDLSRYGDTDDYELFAEVFANSQLGAPN